jgi:hypothetical protein
MISNISFRGAAAGAVLLVLSLGLCGCTTGASTPIATPAAPAAVDPPQITVLKYAQLAAASGNTAAHVLAALCTSKPPVIDLGTCNTVKTDLIAIKGAVDQIVVEANKVPATETWVAARINIALIAAGATVHATVADASLQADITGLLGLVRQIVGVQ